MVVGTLNHYEMVKSIELCILGGNGDVKTFQLSLSLVLALLLVLTLVALAHEIQATW